MQLNIGLEKDTLKQVCDLLNSFLADQHVLYIKTRKYHWNVSGPSFLEYHEFFEKQYKAIEAAIDEVAERIRTLGGRPLATLEDFLANTSLQEDKSAEVKTADMFKRLLDDHEQSIRELRVDIAKCEELEDAGTADFLTQLMEAHEKMAWMLRKYLS
ncbi:Dps family protein [Tellurirhabdus bombi]|uniref:Dps family protein n=1 Tax=Tellurirhabdus bombi TaxID=2907205 RepID=UPI001F474709|nr:DNA starvation/stationary phase protection protein [Tellurirhabdus bombi]